MDLDLDQSLTIMTPMHGVVVVVIEVVGVVGFVVVVDLVVEVVVVVGFEVVVDVVVEVVSLFSHVFVTKHPFVEVEVDTRS